MNKYNVIVVGAGPAGLMAAGQAAESGASVLLLEKMETPANKLRITGSGRCNITNTASLTEFIKHFGLNGRFLYPVFNKFFTTELLIFFEKLEIQFVTEPDGKVFPAGNKADTIVNELIKWVKKCGVNLETNYAVNKLLIENGKVIGVEKSSSKHVFYADSIIITTGGASYPGTGSSGDGYTLARSAGHTILKYTASSSLKHFLKNGFLTN